MSHHLDDDALDAALGQLGSPEGAAPVASPADILARAAPVGLPVSAVTTVTASGPLAGARALFRGGLAGGRLVAAVLVAVGAGFGGGVFTQRELHGAGEGASVDDPRPAGAGEGAVAGGSAPAAGAPPSTTVAPDAGEGGAPTGMPAASGLVGQEDMASSRDDAPARFSRPRAGRRAGVRFGAVEAPSDPLPVLTDGTRSAERGVEDDVPQGTVVATGRSAAEAEPEPVEERPAVARAPQRVEAPAVADVDGPGGAGRPFVWTAGVGTALSRLPPRLDADDAPDSPSDEDEPHLGPFGTLGVTWRGTNAARVGYAGAALEGARLYAEDHTLASVGAAANAGVSWERPRVRLDVGGTVGARTVWGRHTRDAQRDEADAEPVVERADSPMEAEEGVRGSWLSFGPTLGVALGERDAARWTFQVAPQVSLARAAPPSPWLQLSVGCEFPVGGSGG